MDSLMQVIGPLLSLAITVAVIAGFWKVFTKAGRQGWKAIIPLYNAYVLLKIVGRPGWWLILYLIPVVNFIIFIVVNNDLSKSFGKGTGFTIGLTFLPFIFGPILGFGSAQYVGPSAGQGSTQTDQPEGTRTE
jgi:hypothetical protein